MVDVSEKELSDWIESRIDSINYNKDLTQRRVALEFEYGNRPYYNKTQMHAALGVTVSAETVKSRMDELHEREVLSREKVNNGDIYWLKSSDTDWPIPPDVEIEPKRTELTVSEWRRKSYVQFAAGSILIAILGTAVTLAGTFQAGGYYQLPIEASTLISAGLSAGLLSYLGLFYSGLLWVLDVPDLEDIELFDTGG